MEWSILFMGPVGAGKTEAIRAISDIEVVNTDVRPTDSVANIKSQTTVAMDVGVLHLSGTDKVRLYGAPGQDRFDFMWDILLEQARGVILLLNHCTPNPLDEMERQLRLIAQRVSSKSLPLVIGVTHVDQNRTLSMNIYDQHVRKIGIEFGDVLPPVFKLDARDKEHVRCLLLALISQHEMQERFPKIARITTTT